MMLPVLRLKRGPRTEWRKAIIAELSDREWHPAGKVFAAVEKLIPHYLATRYMVRRRGQHKDESPQSLISDTDTGRWNLFNDYLRELSVLKAQSGNLPLIRLPTGNRPKVKERKPSLPAPEKKTVEEVCNERQPMSNPEDDIPGRDLYILAEAAARQRGLITRLKEDVQDATEKAVIAEKRLAKAEERLEKAENDVLISAKQPPSLPKNTGGRPTRHDWDEFWLEVFKKIYVDGTEDRRELSRHMLEFCNAAEDPPDEATVRKKLRKLYAKEWMPGK